MKRSSFQRGCRGLGIGIGLLVANVANAGEKSTEPAEQRNETAQRPAGNQKTAVAHKPVESAMSQTLLRAYQREFAILETEKRMLQKRLDTMRDEGEARVQQAKEEYAKYETELMAVTLLADQKERELGRREIEGEQSEEVGAIVETIEAQAVEVLNQSIVSEASAEKTKEPAVAPDVDSKDGTIPARLGKTYTSVLGKLSAGNQIDSFKASFFDESGQKASGTVLRIGQIAAFGVTGSGARALAPAGSGNLKVWPKSRVQRLDANAVSSGSLPLEIFLADNWSQSIEERKDKTPLEIVAAGGTIAWVIVGLGVFALLLSIARVINLYWLGRGVEKQGEAVAAAILEKDFPLAEQICDNNLAISDLLRAVLKSKDESRDTQHDLMDEQILRIFAYIERFGQMILVAAAVAPLLGLLGTVTGMISTFDAITEFGTGDPRVLAGGISEALITTELGLIVAIPSLLLGNLLSGYAERLKGCFETRGLQAANLCREKVGNNAPALVKNEPVWTRVS